MTLRTWTRVPARRVYPTDYEYDGDSDMIDADESDAYAEQMYFSAIDEAVTQRSRETERADTIEPFKDDEIPY